MKRIAFTASLLLSILCFAAFTGVDKNTGLYKIDHSKSGVTWMGKKMIGSHNGMIQVQEGSANFNGKLLTSGTFTLDMSSIKCLDLDREKKQKLENHLMSPDFFDAGKYPLATFKLKRVEQDNFDGGIAIGLLTIKEITREISFPFTINVRNNRMELTANNIKIDRTKYGVTFASRSLKSTLGDKAIDDEFTISFSLVLLKDK